MQDRRRLIEIIQGLSKQESAHQPTAEEWLREQDQRTGNNAAPAPETPALPTAPSLPETAADDPTSANDRPTA
jgi:hypothetical protein